MSGFSQKHTNSKRYMRIQNTLYKKILKDSVKHDCHFDCAEFIKQFEQNICKDKLKNISCRSVSIGLPYPLTSPTVTYYESDPCKKLLEEKQKYLKEYENYVGLFEKEPIDLLNLDSLVCLPQYLVNLAQDKLVDPDPFFDTDYDFYYTGGILRRVTIGSKSYITRPVKTKFICFTDASKPEKNSLIDVSEPIFGLDSFDDDKEVFLTIRHKKKVRFLLQNVCKKIAFKERWSTNNQVPIIDCKLNKHDRSKLSILGVDAKFLTYDLNENKKRQYNFKEKLLQFEYMSTNSIFLISPSSMYVFDNRTKNVDLKSDHHKGVFLCDSLSTFCFSNSDNYVYVASNHNISKVDLRTLTVVKKWSHLLTHVPSMCATVNDKQDELICVSSQAHDDRVLLIDNVHDTNLCKKIPNMIQTLTETNLKYHYHLNEQILPRLKLSSAGFCFFKEINEDIKIYSSNSIGDVFCNNISRFNQESSEIYPILTRWLELLPRETKKMQITGIKEMTDAKKLLKNHIDWCTLKLYTRENKFMEDFHKQIVTDHLELGMIWREDEEEDARNIMPPMDTNNRIAEWLETTVETRPRRMSALDMY